MTFEDWFNVFGYGTLITIVILLTYRSIKFRILFRTLSEMYMQEKSDKSLLLKKVEELYQEQANRELEQTDGFLKFVSDSRDWAFQYIENAQDALKEFDEIVSPILQWNATYGTAMGLDDPYHEKIKQISLAYDRLKSLLPKETETPNN